MVYVAMSRLPVENEIPISGAGSANRNGCDREMGRCGTCRCEPSLACQLSSVAPGKLTWHKFKQKKPGRKCAFLASNQRGRLGLARGDWNEAVPLCLPLKPQTTLSHQPLLPLSWWSKRKGEENWDWNRGLWTNFLAQGCLNSLLIFYSATAGRINDLRDFSYIYCIFVGVWHKTKEVLYWKDPHTSSITYGINFILGAKKMGMGGTNDDLDYKKGWRNTHQI